MTINVSIDLKKLDKTRFKPIKKNSGEEALLNCATDRIEPLFVTKGQPSGLLTGFPDIDRMTNGLHGGEMIIIVARPGLGKSSLMMNWAEHIVLEQKQAAGVFSLEMSAESLIQRSIGSVGRINVRKPWELSETEDFRMVISIDVTQIDRARIKPFKKRNGKTAKFLELVLIDHKSDYGDFMVKQSITKEEREQGVQLPIMGNGKIVGSTKSNPRTRRPPDARGGFSSQRNIGR